MPTTNTTSCSSKHACTELEKRLAHGNLFIRIEPREELTIVKKRGAKPRYRDCLVYFKGQPVMKQVVQFTQQQASGQLLGCNLLYYHTALATEGGGLF